MSEAGLTIEHLGPKGDGIHQGSWERVYVDRALPGDFVQAKVERDPMGLLRGEILEVLEVSPNRQEAPCVHFEGCGNCTLQHVKEKFYRTWKTELVRDAFRKVRLNPRRWLDPVFLGGKNRRRATFSGYRDGDQVVLGYYRRRTQDITDIQTCLIADPALLQLRDAIRPHLKTVLRADCATDVFLQIVDGVADVVLTGPVGRTGEPDKAIHVALTPVLNMDAVARISWRPREDAELKVLLKKGPVRTTFGSMQVGLPPAAFLQPTKEGEAVLVKAVMAALPEKGAFADLFAGCGTFSGPMLDRGSVDAYEAVAPAVSALSTAGRGRELKAIRRDLFENPLRREELNQYDAIVFDPPRGGCPEQAQKMASAKTPMLIGVSCNPTTFARDARLLCDGGYKLQSLQVVDQFLWSHHVETVGVFTR